MKHMFVYVILHNEYGVYGAFALRRDAANVAKAIDGYVRRYRLDEFQVRR